MNSRRFRTLWLGSATLVTLMLGFGYAAAGPDEDFERGSKAYAQDDLITAMDYLGRAAEAGHSDAQVLLGYIMDKAEENETAMQYFRSAADQGNPAGAFHLCSMYAAGDGVERDLQTAVSWYQQAADAGHGQALEVLGEAYLKGALGLSVDREQGLKMLNQAAANGHEPARILLEKYTQDASTETPGSK